jgi:hypothetical protein
MSLRTRSKLHNLVAFVVATLSVFETARAARATEDDPFAGDQPHGAPTSAANGTTPSPTVEGGQPGPQKQGPIASPEEPAEVPPAVVQQLPASAYPEPYIRGLYGSSLWLDMQGLQWPYTPRTGIGLSGYGWIDNMYKLTRVGDPTQSATNTKLFQQGRFLFRVTPTYTNGSWFVQAQAEIVANKDQLVADANSTNLIDADDVWVRVGSWQKWDLTVGRFQAFDVYPLGMGLDLNTDERIGAYDGVNTQQNVAQPYIADYMFNRPPGLGDVALHLYPFRFLRAELLGQWGNSGSENGIGARPALIFDIGWFKARAAAEYQYEFAQDPGIKDTIRNRGVAGSVQFVFAPYVEFGVNGGTAIYDETNPIEMGMENPAKSGNRYSFGGFINASPVPSILPNLLVGAGADYASQHDLVLDNATHANETESNLQTFVAVQYLFYRQLFFKVVGGYAKSHFSDNLSTNPYDDDMFSLRVRLMYLY